jgi:transcriptional regulator with XRE-family HTH domain
LSELKDIRKALGLNQEAMGELFGVKQGVYQRWEVAPNTEVSRSALEKARDIYQKKNKKPWDASKSKSSTTIDLSHLLTREEFAEWRGYWKAGTEKLLADLVDQGRRIAELEKQVADLKQRVSR